MADMSLKCEASIDLVTPGTGRSKSFPLKGSMNCLFDMEELSGRGFYELCERLRTQSMSIADMAAIITAGLKAAGQPAEVEKVSEMIYLTGPGNIIVPVDVFMQRLLLGGRDLGELLAEVTEPLSKTTASRSEDTSASPPPSSDGQKTSSGDPAPQPCGPQSTGGMFDKAGTILTKEPSSHAGKLRLRPGSEPGTNQSR